MSNCEVIWSQQCSALGLASFSCSYGVCTEYVHMYNTQRDSPIILRTGYTRGSSLESKYTSFKTSNLDGNFWLSASLHS